MKKIFLIIFFTSFLFNISQGDETSNKQKELETRIKLLEKEIEIEKLKKELEDQKKANEPKKNDENLKTSNKKQNENLKKVEIIEEDYVLKEIKLIGSFKEPERYPESFKEEFFKECKKFSCIGNKSTKKMAEVFAKSQKYNLKNPGNQIKGMALFEIYYLNVLRKNEKKIAIFIENWPTKKKKTKEVIKLIKLNKSREKMRNALGMDLDTSVEDAIEVYSIMANFLNMGTSKEQKISKELKLRNKFLKDYKTVVSKFNSQFKTYESENLYDQIKKK
tara:strand:- start:528 stop:1358 length:831 start_codon:yes stop_codon:yes gene_type:complete